MVAANDTTWLTPADLAKRFKCSEDAVIDHLAKQIPHKRIGKLYRFHPDAVSAWEQACESDARVRTARIARRSGRLRTLREQLPQELLDL